MNHRSKALPLQEVVEAQGHLVDSHIMEQIFDTVVEFKGRFEVEQFHVGRTNDEPSHLRLKVEADDAASMHKMLSTLLTLGCSMVDSRDAELRTVEHAHRQGQKIVVVAGPVVVHTGGDSPLAALIRDGYVDALLTGNALGVHDIENALFGTSLGIRQSDGRQEEHGHRNHMRAINAIYHAGGIRKAVETGRLSRGIMYECVKAGVPFVLAGSLRDDRPLPATI